MNQPVARGLGMEESVQAASRSTCVRTAHLERNSMQRAARDHRHVALIAFHRGFIQVCE